MFRSTPPRGRRLQTLFVTSKHSVFRSTPPRGRRHRSMDRNSRCNCFDPRLRAGGDARAKGTASPGTVFRSTPPRGRRLARLAKSFTAPMFRSTPPRGRRLADLHAEASRIEVSIHASAREATLWSAVIPMTPLSFDPRLRAGGDRRQERPSPRSTGFDPRLRAGGDLSTPGRRAVDDQFRSTPPRGRRLGTAPTSRAGSRFDPRLRAGGDDFAPRDAL